MKIVVLDGYCENPGDLSWSGLEALGKLTVYDRTPDDENVIVQRIADNQAVIVNKVRITREIMDACPNIEYIGVLATGYNVVDTAAAAKRGIPVTNIPTYCTAAVAQLTLALLLEVCHHVGHHNEAVKSGRWTSSPDFSFCDYPLTELKGKTMGIVGYGRIGKEVEKLAKAFNMDVVVNKHRLSLDDDLTHYVPINELYGVSDVISLHCPLNSENQQMINAQSIAKMKDGVIILNTSRGGLVNEKELATALKSGKVSYAAVDVVTEEPIRADNPLLQCENCIITPHIAWAPKESRQRLMETAVMNLISFMYGEPINVVNF